MTDRQLVTLAAIGGIVWYLAVNNKPVALVQGVPGVPELPPAQGDRLSLVTPSYTTNTASTNVNNLVQAFTGLVNKIGATLTGVLTIGNKPLDPSYSFSASSALTGNAPASGYQVPSVGAEKPFHDPTLDHQDPFWGWDVGGGSYDGLG